MKRKIKAGTTNHIEHVAIDDTSSSTGAGLTGLVYNSAGLTAKYKRTGEATWTSISLVTATAGTFASGGFIESDSGAGGEYEFHTPDAALAASAVGCVIAIYGATDMAPVRIEYELDAIDYQDADDLGLAALTGNVPQTEDHTTKIDSIKSSLTTLVVDVGNAGAGLTAIPDMATAANQVTIAAYIDTEISSIITLIGTPAADLAADIAAIPTAAEIDTELTSAHGSGSWSPGSATLVVSASAPALTVINAGGTITIRRGDYQTWQLTGVGSLAGRTGEKLVFTVRDKPPVDPTVDDDSAFLQVGETTGAIRLLGQPTTASYATITVDDEDDGDVTFELEAELCDVLRLVEGYHWDLKVIDANGKPQTKTRGLFTVEGDITRSTS